MSDICPDPAGYQRLFSYFLRPLQLIQSVSDINIQCILSQHPTAYVGIQFTETEVCFGMLIINHLLHLCPEQFIYRTINSDTDHAAFFISFYLMQHPFVRLHHLPGIFIDNLA